jgi:hypothetical protein
VTFSTLDPLAWRAFLGVLVHGLYAAIACVGLGRPSVRGVLAWTAIGLSASVALHSLNNGVQGLFLLVLGLDGLPIYLLVDSVQLLLIAIGAALLIYVWRRRRPVPLVQTPPAKGSFVTHGGL